MEYNYKELEQALKLIKDICNKNQYCYACPFGRGDLCWLYDEPCTWDINKILYNK